MQREHAEDASFTLGLRIHAPNQRIAPQNWQREIAIPSFGSGRITFDFVLKAPERQRALAIPDQAIERRKQRRQRWGRRIFEQRQVVAVDVGGRVPAFDLHLDGATFGDPAAQQRIETSPLLAKIIRQLACRRNPQRPQADFSQLLAGLLECWRSGIVPGWQHPLG